ncbi:MAG: glycosyltransferase family 2 protein [Candidatus Dojkabacteria bacterium]|nr:MAG: glycosyltransferase family 2 protein [Candidatus Dojkabacteria bacterium]
MKQIDIIIPVYNEEGNLERLIKTLKETFSPLQNKYAFSYIFINDGSKDKSADMLDEFQKNDDSFTVIHFSRNFGHQIAITAGIDMSTADAAIIMDADMQDPPSVCIDLIKEWEAGYEVVYAQRKTRKDTPFKKWTAFLFYRLLAIFANIHIPKDTGDFRLMDRKVVKALQQFRESNRFMRGLVSYVGFKQTAVQFDRDERFSGKTHYPLAKMLSLALDAITSFSAVPLQLIAQFGWFTTLISSLGILYALVLRIFFPDITVSGWTTLLFSVLFIGGVQLTMLGVLGIYIGRIYKEVQHRPLYIVSAVRSNKSNAQDK